MASASVAAWPGVRSSAPSARCLGLGVGDALGELAGEDQRRGQPVDVGAGGGEAAGDVVEQRRGRGGAPAIAVDEHVRRARAGGGRRRGEVLEGRRPVLRGAAGDPLGPGLELAAGGRDLLAGVLGAARAPQRRVAAVDEDAERHQRRAADAVLAVDEEAAAGGLAGEGGRPRRASPG